MSTRSVGLAFFRHLDHEVGVGMDMAEVMKAVGQPAHLDLVPVVAGPAVPAPTEEQQK